MLRQERVFPLLPATATDVAAALNVPGRVASRYLCHAADAGRLEVVGERAVEVAGRTVVRRVYAVPAARRGGEAWMSAGSALQELAGVPWIQRRNPVPRLTERHVGRVRTREHRILDSAWGADE